MRGSADARRHRRRFEAPHLLGIDDGPFDKRGDRDVVIVGVAMEGARLVETIATTRFAVDGDDATGFLARWIRRLRIAPGLQGIVVGGITIAGLGVIDLPAFADATRVPVLAVSRKNPVDHRLAAAFRAAGLDDRMAIVARTPPATRLGDRLFVACAGTTPERAALLVRATQAKAAVPEPLRLAHMIARAIVAGESRGRA